MLVLSRKKNESIVINGNIRIEVLQIKGKQIRLGITAPSIMKVLRGELPPRPEAAQIGDRRTDSRSPDDKKPTAASAKTETQVIECDIETLLGTALATV